MHLSQLYELSLAIGQSIDLHANCEHFLTALMAVRQLDHTSVWLEERLLGEVDPADQRSAAASWVAVYANPRDKGGLAPLGADHPVVRVALESESHSSSPPGDRFRAIGTTIRGNEGAVALYRLGGLGFVTWYSKYHKGPYVAEEFSEIRVLLDKFATSLEACLDHQRLRREVTLRKRAESAVRHSEEHFRSLIENALDVILVLGYDGTITFASPSVERVLGYPAKALEGSSLFTRVHPDDATALFRSFQREVMAPGIVAAFEFRFAHASGGFRTVSASTNNLLATPAVAGIIVNLNDVTERNQMREALRRSEERYSLAVRGANDGIWDWDLASGDLYLSPRWKEMVGYGDDELPSSPDAWLGLVAADDLEGLREALDAQLAAGSDLFQHQYRMHHHDGDLRWMLTRGLAVSGDDGVVVRMAGSQTDVTDRIRHTSELEEARRRAVEASRAKGEFLANMSHEIRTPMNGVIGMASLLLERVRDPELREYVETIRTSGETLLAVVNDILDFSKVEAGRIELERAPFNLIDCVEGAMDVVAPLLVDRPVGLGAWFESSVPECVVGDLARVRQILVNLVSNAAKFTAKGHILVTVGAVPGVDGLDEIQVEVRDTGIGISAAALDSLFTPFSQADASTTRRYGGTGLGLVICRRLCELMGGRIWVESEVGVGSAFIFTFKVQPAAAGGEARAGAATLADSRAVVVKEDAVLAAVVVRHLVRLGGRAEVVPSLAAAARWLAEHEPPALLLVDGRLAHDHPDDWLELVKRAGSVPVVAMAPLGARMDSRVAGTVGASLSEPLKRRQVDSVVATVLGRERSGEPAAWVERPEGAELDRLAILLAEDNPVNQKVAQLMLRRLGCRANLATTGIEVLEMVAARAYDVILMDVQMPGMDGLEATRRIRAGAARGRPWIVAMTAHAMAEDRDRCLAAGMDAYLAKPMELAQVEEALRAGLAATMPKRGGDGVRPAMLPTPSAAVVAAFLAELPALLASLDRARNRRDLDEIVRAAMVIRGAAGVAGQETLADVAHGLEQAAASRRLDDVGGLIDELGRRFDDAWAELGAGAGRPTGALESPPRGGGA